jgi:hypothetical protein
VELVDISGTNRSNIRKLKSRNLKTNSNSKNIREFYRGINDFKKGYQPITNIVKSERGDLVTYLVTYSHSIWAKVEKTFLSSTACTWGLMVLGRQTYIQQGH